MEYTYLLQIDRTTSNSIYLPPSCNVPSSIKYASFGTLTFPCTIKQHSNKKREILLSEDLYKALKIPFLGRAHVFANEDTILFGPLIAIFTAGFTNSLLRPIGERSLFFAKLLALEEKLGAFAFIFGIHQINWEKGTINGLFHDESGWTQHEFPFPDVIYDRLPNRKIENSETFKAIKSRLMNEYLIPLFNPSFFDKWEIHQLLQNNEQTEKFLPETYSQPNIELIKQMLDKHQNVFLKPINGSLGQGVYKLFYSSKDNSYYTRYQDRSYDNRLRKFSSFEKLEKFLKERVNLEGYIIQQGIVLKRKHGQQFDFRVHTNKNRQGKWQISAIAGKIAGKGSVTTHIHNGGCVKTIDEIMINPNEREIIKSQLKDAATIISEVIDSKIDGKIGEIGFDFGIDKNNHIWFFEANSRPGRAIFTHPKLKKDELLSRQLSMGYAIYLSEQIHLHPEKVFQ